MTEPSGTVEAVAKAIYLAMNADKGGQWECVEPRYQQEVWGSYARTAIAALPTPSDQEKRISELEEALREAREDILAYTRARWSEFEGSDEDAVGFIDRALSPERTPT